MHDGEPSAPLTTPEMLAEIAEAIHDEAGFATVVFNLYRPATDDYAATVVRGGDDVRAALDGTTLSRGAWMTLLDSRFERLGTYLLPDGEAAMPDDVIFFEPEADGDDGDSRWRRGDMLVVPILTPSRDILGVISVDQPTSGLRPSDWQLFKLRGLASKAAEAMGAPQADV